MLSSINNKHFCFVYPEKQLYINVINFVKNHNSPSDLNLYNFDGLGSMIFSLCRMKMTFFTDTSTIDFSFQHGLRGPFGRTAFVMLYAAYT